MCIYYLDVSKDSSKEFEIVRDIIVAMPFNYLIWDMLFSPILLTTSMLHTLLRRLWMMIWNTPIIFTCRIGFVHKSNICIFDHQFQKKKIHDIR